jgi:hypothetical protein
MSALTRASEVKGQNDSNGLNTFVAKVLDFVM